ncbi:MAG: formyltetrahydrofolate deformylase [Actinobacteria bacterium]|nr:formyltetrahydrofolate deformylase [Actinomycetota bacterium]MCI0678706.1 formyltetrahydrofolate deformylase [Actinomycetota bacterium]
MRCPDRPGIVNRVTGALLKVGGNITESAQFGDPDTATFALRTVFDSAELHEVVESTMEGVADELDAVLRVRPLAARQRALIMVSRHEHCLLDLLFRHRTGELAIEIPLVMSNHQDCRPLATQYGIPFEHVPVTPETRDHAESRLLDRVDELGVDFVVLARYMQVLSNRVCDRLPGRIINIHHSFLPGFKGSRPYHQAHERGVKLIGATAHYVTMDLDEGPIIDQDVARVTHAQSAEEMVRIGRDVERIVLSRAVRYHSEDRVVLIGSKTVVFA